MLLAVITTVGILGCNRSSTAESALITYVCESDIITKAGPVYSELQQLAQNSAQLTVQDLMTKSQQLQSLLLPVVQEVRANPKLAQHRAYFGKIYAKPEGERGQITSSLAQKASHVCPQKASNVDRTAAAVAVVIGSFRQ